MTSSLILSDEQMFRAVRERDPAADRCFVYGVMSTGVYCLPSCPSRSASEDNLRFFLEAGSALAAGYRACKRCRPEQALAERQLLEASARSIIDTQEAASVLTRLAAELGISKAASRKRFTRWLGVTPNTLATAARQKALKRALKRGAHVLEAINEAGYGSTRSAYESSQRLGMTLSAYRNGAEREHIIFALKETAYGLMLLAATHRGVCFCQFGDSEAALRDELAIEFPHADLEPANHADHTELDIWISALHAHLDETGPRPDVPLDLRGSIFQIRVWRFLLGLDEGETVSYTDVARAVKQPSAARAAASACASNRVAVLVPCHRVLRGDGRLGGYRWGVARKRALLDREREREQKA